MLIDMVYYQGSTAGAFYLIVEISSTMVCTYNELLCMDDAGHASWPFDPVSPIRLVHTGCMFIRTSSIQWVALAIVIYSETRA
jgi:hypothetical protein